MNTEIVVIDLEDDTVATAASGERTRPAGVLQAKRKRERGDEPAQQRDEAPRFSAPSATKRKRASADDSMQDADGDGQTADESADAEVRCSFTFKSVAKARHIFSAVGLARRAVHMRLDARGVYMREFTQDCSGMVTCIIGARSDLIEDYRFSGRAEPAGQT